MIGTVQMDNTGTEDMGRKLISVLATGSILLAGAAGLQSAFSQESKAQPEIAGLFYTVEATATVETIDPQARQILLRLPDESLVTLNVGPETENLDRFKPGDHVVAKYIEAAAVRIAKPDGTGGAATPASASTAATPGRQIHDRSTVLAVDKSRNTLSFAGSGNKVQTIVMHDPATIAFLRTLTTGDPVEVTYTEGVVISLRPVHT
jgi:hypothetical protein